MSFWLRNKLASFYFMNFIKEAFLTNRKASLCIGVGFTGLVDSQDEVV